MIPVVTIIMIEIKYRVNSSTAKSEWEEYRAPLMSSLSYLMRHYIFRINGVVYNSLTKEFLHEANTALIWEKLSDRRRNKTN